MDLLIYLLVSVSVSVPERTAGLRVRLVVLTVLVQAVEVVEVQEEEMLVEVGGSQVLARAYQLVCSISFPELLHLTYDVWQGYGIYVVLELELGLGVGLGVLQRKIT